jgi:hypothetical protein
MFKRLKASANVIEPSVNVPDRPFQTSLMLKGEPEHSQVEQLLLALL